MSLTGASALAAEKVTVRFGNTAGEDDIQSISLRDVAGRLAEATDGNFDAQVYLSSSLGDTDDLTEQAMQGAPIVTVSDPSRLQSFVKDYGILGMPYMFDSYEGLDKQTENTNFALLVSKHFSEPFKDSNGYGESIARLSNMLGGGVIVQRFGDLVRGRRSTEKRIEEGLVTPTLSATPGDLSLVLPKRIMDGIIEMIYALDKVAPGTANDDTLLYGVEVKFYNMEVEIDKNLESCHKGLYVIGDGSGVTHSLSHASASGVYVARHIISEEE